LKKFGNTRFEYDANGLRTKKGNKEYVWSGDRLLYEKEDGEITTRYFYDASGIAGYNYRGGEFKFRFYKTYFGKRNSGDVAVDYQSFIRGANNRQTISRIY